MFILKKINSKLLSCPSDSSPNQSCHQPSQLLSTLYGNFIITEPILLDLLSSHSVERLKKINQYGADFFVGTKKRFTRYDHSIGVLCLLRKIQAPLNEQIAGLLHDVSHTVFSHTGEIVYDHHSLTGSYQDDIHEWYLQQTEIPAILEKYGLTVKDIHHKNPHFNALEQDLPELCADRLDYNMFGGVIDLLVTPRDIAEIVNDLQFAHGRWFFTQPDLAKKLAHIPLHLTEHHFGSAYDLFMNRLTGELLKYALSIGLLSDHEIHFSIDQDVWNKVTQSSDATIQSLVHRLQTTTKITFGDKQSHDLWLPSKNRGIDPWISINNSFVRLSSLDLEFKEKFQRVKRLLHDGWYIRFS